MELLILRIEDTDKERSKDEHKNSNYQIFKVDWYRA